MGSDDDLTDAAAETDPPRAVAAIHDFLKTVADHQAVCALEFRGKLFRFKDVDQVARSAERLSLDNLHEDEQWIDGYFQGVLPQRRAFEFKIGQTGEIIAGRVGLQIEDPSAINSILGQPTRIQVLATRIGDGRPRYLLRYYEEPATEE